MFLRTVCVFQQKKLLAATASLALLAGCTSDFGPWPMPTGYTYHQEQYKAPPGPEPVFRKWEAELKKESNAPVLPSLDTHLAPYQATVADVSAVHATAERNDPQLWLDAANDLAARLFTKFGKPTESVYIPPGGSAGDRQFFAAALHASLQEQGVTIAAAAGGGPFTLSYDIRGTVGGRALLTVRLQSGPRTLAEESGSYFVGGSGGAASAAAPSPAGAPLSLTGPGSM